MTMLAHAQSEEPGSFIRGRKFSAAELYLMVLELLQRQPRHGYEIAKEFKALSLGFYSPSPGALYPVLSQMASQGHAAVQADGKRKRYSLTAAGKKHLQNQAQEVDLLFARLSHAAKKMLWVAHSTDPQAAAQATGWLPEFVAARSALRMALLAGTNAGHDEQRRLVAILNKAVAEIQGTPPA